jgi:hypothetical protein
VRLLELGPLGLQSFASKFQRSPVQAFNELDILIAVDVRDLSDELQLFSDMVEGVKLVVLRMKACFGNFPASCVLVFIS